jgi:hypothetical protein
MNILKKDTDYESILPMTMIQDHCYINEPDQLSILEAYRAAAIANAESYLNRFITKTELEIYTERTCITLPYGGVSVISVEDKGANPVEFDFNRVTKQITTRGHVFIKFNSGYETLPDGLRLALLMMIATAYENRESISNGVSVMEIPLSHISILELYRIPAGVFS